MTTATLISIFVAFVLICLIWWGFNRIAAAFGLPAPIVIVAQVIFVLAVILWLLSRAGGL